jgi:hypothetical protein
MKFKSVFILIVFSVFCAGSVSAKSLQGILGGLGDLGSQLKEAVSPNSLEDIEKLLLEKNYAQADIEFNKLWNRLSRTDRNKIRPPYKATVAWLKDVDKNELFIENAYKNLSAYKAVGNFIIYEEKSNGQKSQYCKKDSITGNLPHALPFSANFVNYINERRRKAVNSFVSLNNELIRINEIEKEKARLAKIERENAEKEKARLAKIEREEAAKERALSVKKKREEKEKKKEQEKREKQEKIDSEISRLTVLAQKAGYSRFSNINVVSMIYKTQKEGGLENYINTVVGCHKLNQSYCDAWYSKLKAIQVLDNGVLYSFSEFNGDEYVDFTIFADKERGKIYQDGQSFSKGLYVFDGMITYTTVSGATKTIPHFKPVMFN